MRTVAPVRRRVKEACRRTRRPPRATLGLWLVVVSAAPARAQERRDSLVYHLAIAAPLRHLLVDARLTVAEPGRVVLAAPAAAARAGTRVAGFLATDDRGVPLSVARSAGSFGVELRAAGALRFRYRLEFENGVAGGSTAAGLDSTRLYAVTRSVFVAPDPVSYRKSSRRYPALRVSVVAPSAWKVVTGWGTGQDEYRPRSGEDLLGSTIAAAPDYRILRDTVAGVAVVVAIRGRRSFADSALLVVIRESLRRGARALGGPPVPLVTYTSDVGRKGRTSGSLQGTASIGLVWEPGELLERARSHDTFHETLHLWLGGALESERWWTEGVTDYLAARLYAEWRGHPEDLAALCYDSYRNYLGIRHNASVTMRDEERRQLGGDHTSLLVYRKGMLAGLLLDATIRRSTGGRASLDDVAHRMLRLAAGRRSRHVPEPEIEGLIRQVGGGHVQRVWDRVVAGRGLLAEDEVTDALRAVTGRTLSPPPPRRALPKALSGYVSQ